MWQEFFVVHKASELHSEVSTWYLGLDSGTKAKQWARRWLPYQCRVVPFSVFHVTEDGTERIQAVLLSGLSTGRRTTPVGGGEGDVT